jgi:hypothetical protein
MGNRPVGKSRQRWQEDVTEELKKLKVKNWKEELKDRRTWRDLAEKTKNPQRVVMPNDDDDDYYYIYIYIPKFEIVISTLRYSRCRLKDNVKLGFLVSWFP